MQVKDMLGGLGSTKAFERGAQVGGLLITPDPGP